MDDTEWLNRYYDRENKYTHEQSVQNRINQDRVITITCDSNRLNRFDAQVALISAANLFGRMNSKVVLGFDDVPMNLNLPWSNSSLHEFILNQMRSAFPFGKYEARRSNDDDFIIHYGCEGKGFVFDGSGWNSYLGYNSSNLPDVPDGNIFGATFSVILAARHFFVHKYESVNENLLFNTLYWNNDILSDSFNLTDIEIGKVFFVGVGSVGSASLYYLTLQTRKFEPTLFDKKRVKIHNLSRSPIFSAIDCKGEDFERNQTKFKVDVAEQFLRNSGISLIGGDHIELHKSNLWIGREMGIPDVIVSAANEDDVRRCIEFGYPPVQIYATTGEHWQITLLRHLPNENSCSMCVFKPDEVVGNFACAKNTNEESANMNIDAALPFLSFGAGLMIACEIVKLNLPNFPFVGNQVFLNLYSTPRFVNTNITHRDGCDCEKLDPEYHKAIIRGSRYASI